jgi:hypothetical protein
MSTGWSVEIESGYVVLPSEIGPGELLAALQTERVSSSGGDAQHTSPSDVNMANLSISSPAQALVPAPTPPLDVNTSTHLPATHAALADPSPEAPPTAAALAPTFPLAHEALSMYAQKITEHPANQKYRKIKLSNPLFASRVWVHLPARTLMEQTGWRTDLEAGCLILPLDATPELMVAALLMEQWNQLCLV